MDACLDILADYLNAADLVRVGLCAKSLIVTADGMRHVWLQRLRTIPGGAKSRKRSMCWLHVLRAAASSSQRCRCCMSTQGRPCFMSTSGGNRLMRLCVKCRADPYFRLFTTKEFIRALQQVRQKSGWMRLKRSALFELRRFACRGSTGGARSKVHLYWAFPLLRAGASL